MADKDSLLRLAKMDGAVWQYVEETHGDHDAGLTRAFTSSERDAIPNIHLGAQEGKFLELLAGLIGAKKIVEVGTLAGYSAMRLARGMGPAGHVWTIEFEPKHAAVARANIEAAGLSSRIDVIVGEGETALSTLIGQAPFDLMFIDANKEGYGAYAEWARVNLRPGGVLVGDNAFLFGQLLEETERGRGMRRFHEICAEHFFSACVPTPEGMVVARKR
jgi:predicted O-methyltransferase YrrM